jgi:hypothetical protein
MARDYYETTIALPDSAAGYAMKPLSAVKVSVVPRGATDIPNSLVDIFPADTGLTKGPDPKSGATGTNPFTTGASGAVRFWAEGPFEYDIVFEDTVTPARIDDRVGWNAIPAKAASIPTNLLKLDAGIVAGMVSPTLTAQQFPIGGVLEWWRPPGSPPDVYPAGYEIADGRNVATHEFPGVAGSVTLPNLQNCFILGATVTKADGTGATADNTPGGAPGIRGTGGSNLPRNLAHGHGVPGVDHLHLCHAADHTHACGGLYTGGHSHAVGTSATGYYVAHYVAAGGATQIANRDHTHSGWTDAPGNLGIGGNTAGSDRSLDAWSGASDRSLNTATNSTTWTADPGTEFRPYFYGLLRLIKVRRTL